MSDRIPRWAERAFRRCTTHLGMIRRGRGKEFQALLQSKNRQIRARAEAVARHHAELKAEIEAVWEAEERAAGIPWFDPWTEPPDDDDELILWSDGVPAGEPYHDMSVEYELVVWSDGVPASRPYHGTNDEPFDPYPWDSPF